MAASVETVPWFEGGPITFVEDKGVIQEYRFSALIVDLAASGTRKLQEALDAGPFLPGQESDSYPGLHCKSRIPTMTEPTRARIDYVFHRRDSGFYTFRFGIGNYNSAVEFVWSGGSSMTQVESAVDAFGVPAKVFHTWSENDFKPAGIIGKEDSNTAILNVTQPLSTVTGRGYLQASYPDIIQRAWEGYVNSDIWAGEPPGTWGCISVNWIPVDSTKTPTLFEFEFVFENRPYGFQPTEFFTNPNTGFPPTTIQPGVGIRTFIWYPSRDFTPYFPV